MRKNKSYIIIVALLFTSVFAQAQKLEVDRMVYAWGNMKNMVVKSVQKLPEDKWQFTPGDSMKTFVEQVKHISTSTRFFPGSVAGRGQEVQALNKKTGELTSKADVIADLEQSFDFAIESLKQIEDWERIRDAFGNKVSNLELIFQAEHHLHREQGKLIIYLRMNGIAPARSTSWFK